MRIGFVDRKLNLVTGGGSNIDVDQMATGLVELGHEVSLITLSPAQNVLPRRVPYRIIEAPSRSRGYLPPMELASILRRYEHEFDLYGIEAPSLIAPAGLYRWLGGRVPVVAHLYDYVFFCTAQRRMDASCYRHCSLWDRLQHRPEPALRKPLLAPYRIAADYWNPFLAGKVDRFIAISPSEAEIYSRHGIAADKTVVIPLSRDVTRLASKPRVVRPEAREPGSPFRILYVGRLERQKGVDVLIQAAAGLDFPFVLDILGDGKERGALQTLADRIGIAACVNFRGWISQTDVVDWYASAHLFVHPGRWPEPFGLTVVEALATGTPTIVSDIGGPPWIVGDAGLTFLPDNPDDLRAKIEAVYESPCLAGSLSARSKERTKEFDRRSIVTRLESLYRSTVMASKDC